VSLVQKRIFAVDEILVYYNKCNITIKGKDIKTLKPGGWLNDEIINCFLSLLQYKFDPTLTKIYIYNSFIFSWINDGTFIKKLHWSLVQKFFTFEIMFLPIHSPGHWSLVVINVQKKEVFYYDSLLLEDIEVTNSIFDKLSVFLKYIEFRPMEVAGTVNSGSSRKLHQEKQQQQQQQQQQSADIYLSKGGWKFISCGNTIPQQNNTSD